MTEPSRDRLVHIVKKFDIAMLVTKSGSQLRARPMAVAEADDEANLLFATGFESGKVEEIEDDAEVAVIFQGDRMYASVSGKARVERDRAKIKQLWREPWRVWFPDGPDDPKLVLVRVDARDGEYWDNAGTKGLRYLLDAARALVRGETPAARPDQHDKASL